MKGGRFYFPRCTSPQLRDCPPDEVSSFPHECGHVSKCAKAPPAPKCGVPLNPDAACFVPSSGACDIATGLQLAFPHHRSLTSIVSRLNPHAAPFVPALLHVGNIEGLGAGGGDESIAGYPESSLIPLDVSACVLGSVIVDDVLDQWFGHSRGGHIQSWC